DQTDVVRQVCCSIDSTHFNTIPGNGIDQSITLVTREVDHSDQSAGSRHDMLFIVLFGEGVFVIVEVVIDKGIFSHVTIIHLEATTLQPGIANKAVAVTTNQVFLIQQAGPGIENLETTQ